MPCQAKIARPAPDQGEIGNVLPYLLQLVGGWEHGSLDGEELRLRASPRESVPASGGDVIAESSDE
jgi:hypothetical protein